MWKFSAAVLALSACIGAITGEAEGKPVAEAVTAAEKGQLKNPHKDNPQAVEEGKKLYMSAGCNGCHGGTGGGGMGPPLTNPIWVYGNDDDTLFRLIAIGSDELLKSGFTRKSKEGVVGPMPPFKDIVKSDEDLWKIVTWIQSLEKK